MLVILWITSVFLFLCQGAIGKKSVDEAIVHWTFNFTTATDTIADSDANQRFILHGTLARSDTIFLNENNRSTRFQKGQIDEFNVTTRDIGRLTNITFWNDRTGQAGPIWNIEKAEFTNHDYNVTYEIFNLRVQYRKSFYYISDETTTMYITEITTSNPSTEPSITVFVTTEETEEEITTESVEPTVESTIETTTNRVEPTTQPDMCLCKCVIPVNRTKEEEETYLQELTKELSIPKKNMSSYIRKKTSAPDHRISAQAAGYIGVVFIILPFLLIIAGDLAKLVIYCSSSK